jgi:hypothetical protein
MQLHLQLTSSVLIFKDLQLDLVAIALLAAPPMLAEA